MAISPTLTLRTNNHGYSRSNLPHNIPKPRNLPSDTEALAILAIPTRRANSLRARSAFEMPPQKLVQRKNYNVHQQSHIHALPVQASDYESEAYVPPTTEKRTNEEINFSVLQRYVPNLQTIISIAPSTQIYTFSPEAQTWEKTNTEGTLFVCELPPSPVTGAGQHCIVVLNRRGMENLIVETREIENVEITEQFLLVTLLSSGELKTLGFYMYDDKTETKAVNCQLIMSLWEVAMQEREQEAALAEKFGLTTQEGEDMARGFSMTGQRPMGRRLSLTELFGQQRQ